MAIDNRDIVFSIMPDGTLTANTIRAGVLGADIGIEIPEDGSDDFDTSDFIKYITNLNASGGECL